MSHQNSGWFPAYNSLTDKHLAGYFNNTRIRRHLRRAGLITRSGSIVPDKEYRHKLIRKDHQRHVRECLTQAIFHKVLDIERHHQIEIKRRLEDFARKERVHKIKWDDSDHRYPDILKVQRSKIHDGTVPLITPRPPSGPRNVHTLHSGPEGEQSESSESPGSSRPSTAPGKRRRPVRLRPLCPHSTTTSTRRAFHCCRQKDSSDDAEPYFCSTLKRGTMAHVTMPEFSSGISPYRLPVINNYITPVPPPTNRKERSSKGTSNGRTRGRSLRPTTAPNVPAVTKDSKFHKTTVHSNVSVTMTFYGKAVHLAHDTVDMRDEVTVFQQHCGGENVCVYKGKLMEGEAFQFVSRRHTGFPFSLTFFLNGMQVERLSSCCEFRHRRGSRLGGKHGHFGFTTVDRASPCYKCIIALGLDKKPTPPPKRLKSDKETVGFVGSSMQMARGARKTKTEGVRQDNQFHTGPKSSQGLVEDNTMDREAQEDLPEDKEHKAQDDYEDDFEEDDERVDEDTEETRALIVVNGASSSPSSSHSDSEFEEEGKAKEKKKFSSVSSESISLLTGSRKEDPDSEAEEVKEAIKDNGVDLYPRSINPTELRGKAQTGQDPNTGKGQDTTIEVGEEPQEQYLEAGAAGKAKDQSNTHSRTTSKSELDGEWEIHGRIAKKTSLEESDVMQVMAAVACTPQPLSGAEKKNTEDGGTSSDGALTAPAVEQAQGEGPMERDRGKVRPQETTETGVQEEPDRATEEACSNMENEEPGLDAGGSKTLEPADEPGTESKEGAWESENNNEGTDSGSKASDEDGKERDTENGEALNEGPDHVMLMVEDGKTEEYETISANNRNWLKESTDTVASEATASNLEKQDVKAEDPGEEEEPAAKAEKAEARVEDTATSIRAEQSEGFTEATEISKESRAASEETEAKQKKTEEGEVGQMSEGNDYTEGKTEEDLGDTEAIALTPKDKIGLADKRETEDGGELPEPEKGSKEAPLVEAEIGTEDTESKTEEGNDATENDVQKEKAEKMCDRTEANEEKIMTDRMVKATESNSNEFEAKREGNEITIDTDKAKLIQLLPGEGSEANDQLANAGIMVKQEAAETMRKEMGIMEASSAEAGPRAEKGDNKLKSDHETEIWQTKCEKRATMLEARNITVEEKNNERTDATEKENTAQVWETESSIDKKDEGVGGDIKADDMDGKSDDISAKEATTVRGTKSKVELLETEIEKGVMEGRHAEIGFREKSEEALVGEEPKTEIADEISEEQTIAEDRGWKSSPTETDVNSATAEEAKSLPEASLDKTEEMFLEPDPAGSPVENRNIKTGSSVGQLEGEEVVESSRTGVRVAVPGKVEMKMMAADEAVQRELLKKEMEPGNTNFVSGSTEEDAEIESEVSEDNADALKADTDKKEEQKIRPAVQTEAETHMAKYEPKAVSRGQPEQLKEIEDPNKEAHGVVPECNVEGSESKLEHSQVDVNDKEPLDQEDGPSNNAGTSGEASETAGSEGVNSGEGSAGHEVDSIAKECIADGVKCNPVMEESEIDEDEVTTASGEATFEQRSECQPMDQVVDLHIRCGSVVRDELTPGPKSKTEKPKNEINQWLTLSEPQTTDELKNRSLHSSSEASGKSSVPKETSEAKEGQDGAAEWNTDREHTSKGEQSREGSETSASRSKTELEGRNRAKFPPPLIRSRGSYALMIARQGLSLQPLTANDPESESSLVYTQTTATVTGNAYTASKQKPQRIGTKDM